MFSEGLIEGKDGMITQLKTDQRTRFSRNVSEIQFLDYFSLNLSRPSHSFQIKSLNADVLLSITLTLCKPIFYFFFPQKTKNVNPPPPQVYSSDVKRHDTEMETLVEILPRKLSKKDQNQKTKYRLSNYSFKNQIVS